MFIQLIQGKVRDEAGLRRCMDRWTEELQPGATGYLGHTCGTSDNDIWVGLARFDSAEAARRNSERPEQDRWWAETRQCFEGDVTFMDCPDVTEWLGGGSDDAGFVQVITGQARDIDRMKELNQQYKQYADLRPDLIGGVIALHADKLFTQAAYFTSEAEARAAESQEPPEEVKAVLDEENDLIQSIAYIDLEEPWLYAPK
jgi:hypothetical protein